MHFNGEATSTDSIINQEFLKDIVLYMKYMYNKNKIIVYAAPLRESH